MIAIDLKDTHGFRSPAALGMALLSRSVGAPQKDDHTERVPYSSVTHDFDDYAGASSYGERTLTYKFDLLCRSRREAQYKLSQLRQMMQWRGLRDLYDDALPDYHFEVREPTITTEDGQFTVQLVTLTFKAAPAMLPNQIPALLSTEMRYPDVNGDGKITAADAALILSAAEHIAAGESSGLTAAQELLADADLDGTITEADSVLVLEYVSAVAAGQFEDNLQSWIAFLRRYLAMKEALY